MTDLETLLAERLENRAERIPVGPVPLDALHRAGAVRRRRGPLVVLAAAAAVVVVAVGLAVLDPASRPAPAPPADPAPAGTEPVGRRIGVAHLSVAWPSGPVGVETTRLDPATISSHAWQMRSVRVDGVRVQRSEVDRVLGEWRAVVWVPSEEAGLVVTSSSDAPSVERLLATLRVDPDEVAVPDVAAVDRTPLSAGAYRQVLEEAGLEAVVTVAGDSGAQRVDAVSPAVGSVVPVGSTVRVTVVAQEPSDRP